MKRHLAFAIVLLAAPPLAVSIAEEGTGSSIEYRFDEVRSSVTLRHEETERDAEDGMTAESGDEVETGWFARAVVSVANRGSRFEILSSTKAVLGGPEPGVLVRLEKGRLRAIFDKLVGRDDRLVSAPGALLAVRGTRYGLEVDRSGNATLAVFEGSVEVLPRGAGIAPIVVGPGELCRIGRDSSCKRGRMPAGMNERSWSQHGGNEMMDSGQRDHGGHGNGGSMRGHGGH